MRIVLITQNDPFYLHDNIDHLINIMPNHSSIVGCVLSNPSPFGKQEGFLKKSYRTFRIFGINFFLYYSFKFILNKIFYKKDVFKVLRKHSIPIIKIDDSINSKSSLNEIKRYKPDLLISILGNQIFKEDLINLAPKGCINLHTALLPKYRGLMPTFWVLKNGEKETGVSVFFVDSEIDNGPIIIQKKILIGNKTHKDLIVETKKIGMEAIAKSIDYIFYDNLNMIENKKSESSYYSFPKKRDIVDFKRKGKLFF